MSPNKYQVGDLVTGESGSLIGDNVIRIVAIITDITEGKYGMTFLYSSVFPRTPRYAPRTAWKDEDLRLTTEIERALYL